tara:strand:+ start:105 stop:935 length:831 start_codon:yes stop_codon:yes gene_type:complete
MIKETAASLAQNGYCLLNSFFDLESEIIPIQESIYNLTKKVAERYKLKVDVQPFHPDSFDHIYLQILLKDRKIAGEVYDLVKQLPPFLRLICGEKSEALYCALRNTNQPGIGAGSYGIRIDNPSEKEFQSHWHQEFFYQPQSIDGLVFWTPLVDITKDLGPVQILEKSHLNDLQLYTKNVEYNFKTGAYQYGLYKETDVVKKYQNVTPLSAPGDLILMDFLTIHASGDNNSSRARWSIQYRFFNHNDKTGSDIGWKASATLGSDVQKIFPNNFIGE